MHMFDGVTECRSFQSMILNIQDCNGLNIDNQDIGVRFAYPRCE